MIFGFENVKNLLKSIQVIQKELGDSPEPTFEVESHFENSMKFAIFGNFRIQQRTEAISCKSEPLKGIIQGSQRREKCFLTSQKCQKPSWEPRSDPKTAWGQS